MIWWAAAAWAMDVRVFAPDAAPTAGKRTVIEVALADGDNPVTAPLTVSAARGRMDSPAQMVAPGRWRFTWSVPEGVTEERFSVLVGERRPVEIPLALVPARAGAISATEMVEATTTDGQIALSFPVVGVLRPQDLIVRATEGQIASVRVDGAVVRVELVPEARRDARIIHLGLWDRRRPDTLPVFTAVRLREQKSGTVVVEPGASVTVKIAGRSFGPFRANAAGEAEIGFDVLPGETTYEVLATDDVGNTSRVTSPLGGVSSRPAALLLDAEDEERATVFVAGWTAPGTPWSGSGPNCRAGTAEPRPAEAVSRGLWRFDVENPRSLALFDLRVECAMGEVAVVTRVPIGAARAERIDLRAWPQELDADFPIAQVQAVLLDARGDRLPVEGLELAAKEGWLALDTTVDAVRADYQGGKAVAAGGDLLTARWTAAASTDPPWNLHVAARRAGAGIETSTRVHDRLGRPVAGAEVSVEVWDGVRSAGKASGSTGPTGEAVLTLPGGGALPVVVATSGGAQGATALMPGVDTPAALPAGTLEATLPLPIREGRVRSVVVEVTGAAVETGAEVSTPVRVRLFDLANRPITDEQVKIEADYGSIAGLRAEPDGSWTGTYVAPRAIVERAVQLTASADGSSGSATLRLVPRRVRGGVTLGVGYISNFSLVSSPIVTLSGDYRMPFLEQLSVRVGGSGYYLRSSFTDEQTQKAVNVDVNFFPIEVGGVATQRWTRLSLGGGVAALFVPFGIRATYAGTTAEDGTGLTSPGLQVTGEAAWRLGMSELFLGARGMVFPGPTGLVTMEEPTVHLAISAGYRVLY